MKAQICKNCLHENNHSCYCSPNSTCTEFTPADKVEIECTVKFKTKVASGLDFDRKGVKHGILIGLKEQFVITDEMIDSMVIRKVDE